MNNRSSREDQRLRFEQLKISEDDTESEQEETSSDDEENMDMNYQPVNADLVTLWRSIYTTIMSTMDVNEAEQRLLEIELQPGQEMELCVILLECCKNEIAYVRYYGLLGQRLSMINGVHQENFEKCFVQQYSSVIHQLKTNQLVSVAKFFAHLLAKDALPWHVLSCIHLTEEDTTLSSLKFIKILFLELTEHLGIRGLKERLDDPVMQEIMDESIIPRDSLENTSFAIQFFTSIGLHGFTQN